MTGLIDAQENRDAAVVDIAGVFLQTTTSGNTIIKLQGLVVKIMLKINPSREKFGALEGGK